MSEEMEMTIPDKTADPQGYIAYLEGLIADTSNLGEAGGTAWCDIYGMSAADENGVRHLVKINLGGRGRTAAAALRNLADGFAHAKKMGMRPYQPGSGTSQPPQQSQSPATGAAPALPRAGAPQAPAAVPTVPTAPKAQPVAPAGGGVIFTEKVEITPKPGGKAEVGFYGVGHKFPDVRITKTTAELSALFTGATGTQWTEDEFKVADSRNIALNVTWVPSTNTNSKGDPYKNLYKIEPA